MGYGYDPEGSRYCSRCGVATHAPDPPHLCKDLRERYERQAKAVTIIVEILKTRFPDLPNEGGILPEWWDEVALDIVQALAGRDLGT